MIREWDLKNIHPESAACAIICTGKKYRGDILLFSSTLICQPGEDGITEESMIAPRTEIGLCLATAENILGVMLYKDGNEVLPHVLRVGNTKIDEACTKAIELMSIEFCPNLAVI